ncbi:MAG: hypothetical protein MUE45_06830 [Methanoregulaceae archaeon]|nr:hypothetical protein [Methanoregulaceae archaeon]
MKSAVDKGSCSDILAGKICSKGRVERALSVLCLFPGKFPDGGYASAISGILR